MRVREHECVGACVYERSCETVSVRLCESE